MRLHITDIKYDVTRVPDVIEQENLKKTLPKELFYNCNARPDDVQRECGLFIRNETGYSPISFLYGKAVRETKNGGTPMSEKSEKFESRPVQIEAHAIYFHQILEDLSPNARCFLLSVAINYMFNVEMYVTNFYDLMRFTDHIRTIITNIEGFKYLPNDVQTEIDTWYVKLVASYNPAKHIVLKPNLV